VCNSISLVQQWKWIFLRCKFFCTLSFDTKQVNSCSKSSCFLLIMFKDSCSQLLSCSLVRECHSHVFFAEELDRLLTCKLQWSVGSTLVAHEVSGSNPRGAQVCVFHENYCDMQLWAWAAHWLQCQGRLPSTLRRTVNEYQPHGWVFWVIIHGDGRMFGL